MLRNNAVLKIALTLQQTEIAVEKVRTGAYNEHAFETYV